MIEKYESTAIATLNGTACTLMAAFGKINGKQYSIGELADPSEVPVGTITQEFIDTAALAFERAEEVAKEARQ